MTFSYQDRMSGFVLLREFPSTFMEYHDSSGCLILIYKKTSVWSSMENRQQTHQEDTFTLHFQDRAGNMVEIIKVEGALIQRLQRML